MKNPLKTTFLMLIVAFAGLVLFNVFTALTASNTVPVTRADKNSIGLGVHELTPPECEGMGLNNIVDIGAGETGTPANDLILGTDKADAEIRGGAGNDCILGGKGNERQRIGGVWSPGVYGE
ncbi:MAG: hypothetical protein HQ574_07025, partial [Chloroflexi bacterium]|nr:hypothetical protein [Chloroflexota bacterium]